MKVRIFIWSLAASLTVVACDRNSAPPTPTPGPTSPVEQINGTERLGWDQQAADAAALGSFRYAIYVDGARSELAAASCATAPTAGGFACSARLPSIAAGAHTLELAAFIVDGSTLLESPRSVALRVTVAAVLTQLADSRLKPATLTETGRVKPVLTDEAVATEDVSPTGETDRLKPAAADEAGATYGVTTADRVRLRVEIVAEGLQWPTDVAFVPDGRILVAERGGRVRVVRDGRLLPEAALTLEDVTTVGGGGLLALTVDPHFARTHFVYALYTTPSPVHGAAFRLARFREVQDTLADRVILLDEVPASPVRAAASIRFGPDGKLYVALDDGGDARRVGDMAAYNGKILRINADGSTPDDQPGATPVYAAGYRSPRGFDWHPATGVLWIADAESRDRLRLTVVATDRRSTRATTREAVALPGLIGASALGFYRGGQIPEFDHNLFVAADEGHQILRVRFDPADPSRVLATEALLRDRSGPVRTVTAGTDGSIYFCTDHRLAKIVSFGTP